MTIYERPDYLRFIAAIRERPDDDLPRLMCADWLEEHGEGDRAAFVRCQIEGNELQSNELHYANRDQWYPFPGECDWRRGWPESIRIRGADWIDHADEILKRNPVRKVAMVGPEPEELTVGPLMDRNQNTLRFKGFKFFGWDHSRSCDRWPGVEFTFEREVDGPMYYADDQIHMNSAGYAAPGLYFGNESITVD